MKQSSIQLIMNLTYHHKYLTTCAGSKAETQIIIVHLWVGRESAELPTGEGH